MLKQILATAAPESLKIRYHIYRNAYVGWVHSRHSAEDTPIIPAEVSQYLSCENPKLLDLRRRYADKALFTDTFWKDWRKHINLRQFRSEGHYLAQHFGHNVEAQYLATTAYVELVDDWNLLDTLKEDGLFGCHTFRFLRDQRVSRDLLDSILELGFLRKTLNVSRQQELRVLDIGAGYGRFAHRFLEAFPNGSITNIDGVAESTFLCDFYTRFRGLGNRSLTLAADELDKLQGRPFDIAINIHSWSECSRDTVRRWLSILRDLSVPRLFVVPHDADFTTKELQYRTDTFLPEITSAGYKEVAREHKFAKSASLRMNGLFPAWYVLFEL